MTAMNTWDGQPVTILGLSKSGVAVATYLAQKGARCFLSETTPASPVNQDARNALAALGVELEMGGHSDKCFSHSDLVVVSPGIPPHSQVLKELALSGKTIISEVELAYRESQSPWVGITGTNGKTTTTTMVSRILSDWGKSAPACGNVGVPIISLIDDRPDYLVAELSSFQIYFSPTLKAKVAMLLNFRPDHLDWHGSVEAYKRAKFELFLSPHTPEWAILNAQDPTCRELAELTDADILWFSQTPDLVAGYDNAITIDTQGQVQIRSSKLNKSDGLFNVHDLKLVGRHNHENALAAAATAWLLGVPVSVIEETVTGFEGVEHRLEPVLTINGITYYNDSKATNPDAAISALEAFIPGKVVLIAGGKDKMSDLSEFVAAVKAHAAHVVLMGEATGRFRKSLEEAGYTQLEEAGSLRDAIRRATAKASDKMPVLFSPACSSFDMFKNFEERGQAFKSEVQELLAVSHS